MDWEAGIAESPTKRFPRRIHPAYPLTRRSDGHALERLTPLFELGTLRPVVDRVLPLEAVAEPHRISEAGRAVGKIVLSVRA